MFITVQNFWRCNNEVLVVLVEFLLRMCRKGNLSLFITLDSARVNIPSFCKMLPQSVQNANFLTIMFH